MGRKPDYHEKWLERAGDSLIIVSVDLILTFIQSVDKRLSVYFREYCRLKISDAKEIQALYVRGSS